MPMRTVRLSQPHWSMQHCSIQRYAATCNMLTCWVPSVGEGGRQRTVRHLFGEPHFLVLCLFHKSLLINHIASRLLDGPKTAEYISRQYSPHQQSALRKSP